MSKLQRTRMSTKEAAKYLGYSVDSMRRARVDGRLGGVKAPKHHYLAGGCRVFYYRDELEAWAEG
jgi:hypothetical protein